MSRALCAYTRTRLAGKTRQARIAAKLNAAYRQGFSNARARLEIDAADPLQAGIWTWDGDIVLENGQPLSSLRVMPETLAREGLENGARLAKCIDGFEGQVWRNGSLAASRWWHAPPKAREWQHFLRAAQTPVKASAAETTPAPCEVPFRQDLPYIDPDPDNLRLTFAPQRIAAAVGCLLAFFVAFQSAQILAYERASASIAAQIGDVAEANSAGLDARRTALAASAQISQFEQFGDPQAATRALLALASMLSSEKARIANFRIFDGQLEARIVVADGANIRIENLVSALEQSELLADVFVEQRNERTLGVQAVVTGLTQEVSS